MAHYLSLANLDVRRWTRRDGTDIDGALADARVVLLLISDGALPLFAEQHQEFLSGRVVVHCSGGMTVPGVTGMHPLCTFGPELYDRETYERIPFICDADGARFDAVFPTLPNSNYPIPQAVKARYHAGAVLAGNASTALWLKFFAMLEELDIPREAAQTYLEQTCRNLVTVAPEAVLTGPVARRDAATVRANLAALSGDPFADVYRAFVDALAPGLAEELS
jgi:predicted short-subunit dehydrogenase-like oxidoreductase (DUF2520 family)